MRVASSKIAILLLVVAMSVEKMRPKLLCLSMSVA